ncbi:MAG: helix-turn-helix transcriptional regulator [Phycisphaerae bacterium]|jgi:DNA-binding XRE family transcriptional regulator
MLALVRKPRTEISLHGAGTSQVLEFLRKQFIVEILDVDTSSVEDDGDELVDIRDTDFWKQNKHMVLAGYRHKINITQKELAARSGMCQTVISELESGRRPMTLKAATRLAKALNTTPERLMP